MGELRATARGLIVPCAVLHSSCCFSLLVPLRLRAHGAAVQRDRGGDADDGPWPGWDAPMAPPVRRRAQSPTPHPPATLLSCPSPQRRHGALQARDVAPRAAGDTQCCGDGPSYVGVHSRALPPAARPAQHCPLAPGRRRRRVRWARDGARAVGLPPSYPPGTCPCYPAPIIIPHRLSCSSVIFPQHLSSRRHAPWVTAFDVTATTTAMQLSEEC